MTTSTESIEKIKQAPVAEGVHELIRRRWSPRAFSNREVIHEQLRLLLEAARWAPSSYNEQPWRFLIATKANPEEYQRMLSVLVKRNQLWAQTAPVLMITVAKTTFSHNGQPNRHALHDTGLALGFLMTQATFMGLRVHAMAGFDGERARSAFGIPPDYEPGAAVAIGYLGEIDAIPAEFHAAELGPRDRKPLEDLVYSGAWGKPAKI